MNSSSKDDTFDELCGGDGDENADGDADADVDEIVGSCDGVIETDGGLVSTVDGRVDDNIVGSVSRSLSVRCDGDGR